MGQGTDQVRLRLIPITNRVGQLASAAEKARGFRLCFSGTLLWRIRQTVTVNFSTRWLDR